jgi:hypothetical protein
MGCVNPGRSLWVSFSFEAVGWVMHWGVQDAERQKPSAPPITKNITAYLLHRVSSSGRPNSLSKSPLKIKCHSYRILKMPSSS